MSPGGFHRFPFKLHDVLVDVFSYCQIVKVQGSACQQKRQARRTITVALSEMSRAGSYETASGTDIAGYSVDQFSKAGSISLGKSGGGVQTTVQRSLGSLTADQVNNAQVTAYGGGIFVVIFAVVCCHGCVLNNACQ